MDKNSTVEKMYAMPATVVAPPTQFIIDIPDPVTGANRKYLLVAGRIRWFRTFCATANIAGAIKTERMARETLPDGSYTEVFKAEIVLDGTVVATGFGSADSPICPNKAVENAETAAIGRALSNAGFNLEDAATENGEMDGSSITNCAEYPIPCTQAPMPVCPQPMVAPTAMPTGQVPYAPMQGMAQPNPAPSQAKRQAAMTYVCPTGKYQGRTCGEVNATDSNYIRYIAGLVEGKSFRSGPNFPEFVAACKAICGVE